MRFYQISIPLSWHISSCSTTSIQKKLNFPNELQAKVSKTQVFQLDLLKRKKSMELYHQSFFFFKKKRYGISTEMDVSVERELKLKSFQISTNEKVKLLELDFTIQGNW